jgi:hypothetical protein
MGRMEKAVSGEDVREVIEWGCGDGGFGSVKGVGYSLVGKLSAGY